MRRALFLTLALIATVAHAADKAPPGGLAPLPEPPPPPPGLELNPALEPEVTITTRDDQKVEEYRIGGRLYAIRITPKIGKPYYLIDDKGDGHFTQHGDLDSGLRPPQWVIFQF
jgi:hypothetical protein